MITVGFSKPKTFKLFAWIIMTGFNIPYDHVYIKFHSKTYNRDIIYQASQFSVNFMSSDIFLAANQVVQEFEIDIPDDHRKSLMQFCLDNAGKPYGAKEAFGMAIVRIYAIFGKKITNPFRDGRDTYVCSELVGYVLEQFAGAQLPVDVYDLTPPVIYDYLTKVNQKV